MPRFNVEDYLNKQFGELTVIGIEKRNSPNSHPRNYLKCICSCGTTTYVLPYHLKNGHTKSCGCSRTLNGFHGLSNTHAYKEWCYMKSRCLNPNTNRPESYTEKGISIYPIWKNDFKAFYDYVSKLPHFDEAEYSLDRIDNDGNYEPGNVRWANNYQQANNKNRSVKISNGKETKSMSEWCRELNIDYSRVNARYNTAKKRGISLPFEKLFSKEKLKNI